MKRLIETEPRAPARVLATRYICMLLETEGTGPFVENRSKRFQRKKTNFFFKKDLIAYMKQIGELKSVLEADATDGKVIQNFEKRIEHVEVKNGYRKVNSPRSPNDDSFPSLLLYKI